MCLLLVRAKAKIKISQIGKLTTETHKKKHVKSEVPRNRREMALFPLFGCSRESARALCSSLCKGQTQELFARSLVTKAGPAAPEARWCLIFGLIRHGLKGGMCKLTSRVTQLPVTAMYRTHIKHSKSDIPRNFSFPQKTNVLILSYSSSVAAYPLRLVFVDSLHDILVVHLRCPALPALLAGGD